MPPSQALIDQMFRETGYDEPIALLEFEHASIALPDNKIRLARNSEDITHQGNVYVASHIDYAEPSDDPQQAAAASIRMDGIDGSIMAMLRTISTPVTVYAIGILPADPDTIERGPIEATWRTADGGSSFIQGTLEAEEALSEEWPAPAVTPSRAPGAF